MDLQSAGPVRNGTALGNAVGGHARPDATTLDWLTYACGRLKGAAVCMLNPVLFLGSPVSLVLDIHKCRNDPCHLLYRVTHHKAAMFSPLRLIFRAEVPEAPQKPHELSRRITVLFGSRINFLQGDTKYVKFLLYCFYLRATACSHPPVGEPSYINRVYSYMTIAKS